MTADTITAIKKALMELPLMNVEFSESSSEGNSIISPTDDFEDAYFTVIGCGDKQDDLGRLIALAVNSMPGLLSTLESLQRENEALKLRLDIGTQGEDAIDVAESAADFLRHRAETEKAKVKRLTYLLEKVAPPEFSKSWLPPQDYEMIRAALDAALSTGAEPVATVTDETVDRIISLIKGHEWDRLRAYSTVAAVRNLVKSVLEAAPPAPSVAMKAGLLRKIANAPIAPDSRRFTDTNAQNEVIGYERAEWMIDQVISALSAQVQDVAEPKRTWQGWDKDNPQEHQDKVCHALFGSEWWENDEKTLVAFIDRAFSAAKLEEKP